MSVKAMAIVWESDLPQREKFVLLAYADHADHQGNNVFPSVGLIAWKTGYSPRSIQRITQTLVDNQYMIPEGINEKYNTNAYRIDLESLPRLSPYLGGDNLSGGKYGGDSLTGVGEKGGDNLSDRGDKTPSGGDTAVSPDPSVKPSLNRGDIFSAYENNIGPLAPMLSEQVGEWCDSFPLSWIIDAIKIATENNVRRANYIQSILDRWQADGKDAGRRNNESPQTGVSASDLEKLGYATR